MKAAGILFISKGGNALFLRRAASARDYAGCWDFPGGGAEDGESLEETALRETLEEIGQVPKGVRVPHTRTRASSAPGKGVAGPGAAAALPVGANAAPAAQEPTPAADLVDFTTFLQRVDEEFVPKLSAEHDGFAWAPVASPPQPVHPGCQIALDRLSMDELGVARAIAEGRLASPQRYENVTMWAIRLTGTGSSFRPKHDEYVYRPEEIHLNPDALARWNGTPVVMKHPAKNLLDSKEFANRVVGTIFLPYVAGDEAWGIAKVWDDDANRFMQEGDLSTSPGVNFRDFSVNRQLRLEDGSKVLIEGKPSLVDHIAICELGVWDKGGEPSGIRSEAFGDSAMADDDKKPEDKRDDKAKDDAAKRDDAMKTDAAKDDTAKKDAAKKDEDDKDKDKAKDDATRKDADAGKQPDNSLSHVLDAVHAATDAIGTLNKRLDAIEEKDKAKDDAAKKDADDKDDPKKMAADAKRDDAAKKDADDKDTAKTDSAFIREQLGNIDKLVRDAAAKVTPIPDDDYQRVADAWARADDVFSAFGMTTPRAMPGEISALYRRRVVRELKPYSLTWKDVDTAKAFNDEAAFAIVESQVLAEAGSAARSPATAKVGELRTIERKRDGHTIREFVGEPRTWMDPIAGATQLRAQGRFQYNLGNNTLN